MGFPRLSLYIFMPLLCLLSQLHLIINLSSPFMQPQCHRDESFALLQFKESFIIDDPTCQKIASWRVEGDKSDCCSWDGVECNEATGHVIGLDLSASCLKGSIKSSSSLFHLVHLQSLNLAHNDFNNSQIPSQVRNLSRLKDLNFSSSNFFGQIPLEISQLSNLLSLDLSYNWMEYTLFPSLELKQHSLRSLVGNLTRLQKLDLSLVDISSTVPSILANLSSLTSLSLPGCGLYGEFPIEIFKLSNLQYLCVSGNEGLTGYLPDFTWSSRLETLVLALTSFSGELPASMGNLRFLTDLYMENCNFSGSIPSSLGNLTELIGIDLSKNSFVGNIPSSFGNLTKLISLDLSFNAFVGNVPPSLGKLVQCIQLDISHNQLIGPFPFSLVNLPQIEFVDLSYNLLSGEMHFGHMNETRLADLFLSHNGLTGSITFGPMSLTQLEMLDLSANKFHGQISNSIFNLKNLKSLDLSENYLNGIVEFDEFDKLEHLIALSISGNQLSEFPKFLRNQHGLLYLRLSNNKIHGQVPKWMWNTSTRSLQLLDLSSNYLTSFGQHPIFLPWTHLEILDLKSNLLQGSLPMPPASTLNFYISNNLLTGNIPELFCNLSSLQVFDLANNNLSGSLPRCLDNFGVSLSVVDLQRNKFQGSIPKTWIRGSQLKIIILSLNKFQGHLPRSLTKCTMLKVLDLSNNQFNDKFPSWLENLPNLEVLILRSNKFNGPIKSSKSEYMFPNLRIIDLSSNSFVGKLPLKLFGNCYAKISETANHLTYIQVNSTIIPDAYTSYGYDYSMTLTNKGKITFYEKVQELFMVVDISSNRFVGKISEFIENLRGFHLLNLSNNALTGHIPPSLGSLMDLEALDLSQNNLSGEIPQQLTQLTFLEFLNVSHNNLTGPIPQGKQFYTFENNSFEGNLGLCGRPLTRKCENYDDLPSQPSIFEERQDSRSPFEFGWKIVVIGYGFGFAVGVIIGQIVVARKHDWLMKTLWIRPVSGRRRRN